MQSYINNGPPSLYTFAKRVTLGELAANSNQQLITGTNLLAAQGFSIIPIHFYVYNGTANNLDVQLFNAANEQQSELLTLAFGEGIYSNMMATGQITFRWLTTNLNTQGLYFQFGPSDLSPANLVYMQLVYSVSKLSL